MVTQRNFYLGTKLQFPSFKYITEFNFKLASIENTILITVPIEPLYIVDLFKQVSNQNDVTIRAK